jgi:hypothetical protein
MCELEVQGSAHHRDDRFKFGQILDHLSELGSRVIEMTASVPA